MQHLVLPLPPSLTNSGRGRSRHWRSLKRERDAYWAELNLLLAARRIPGPPATPPAFAVLRATLYLWNPMDDDGAMARLKWPLDWLRGHGFIAGDSRRCVRWAGLPDQVIDRRNQRLEITIEPRAA